MSLPIVNGMLMDTAEEMNNKPTALAMVGFSGPARDISFLKLDDDSSPGAREAGSIRPKREFERSAGCLFSGGKVSFVAGGFSVE